MSIDSLRQKYIRYITWIDQYLHSASTIMNDQALNVHIEYTIIRLLNLAYPVSLINANIESSNVKAIDAFDKKNQICYQITSNTSFTKVFTTVKTFVEDEMYSEYGELFFFYLRKKRKLTENQLDKIEHISKKKIGFDNSNLVDFSDLLIELSENFEKLETAITILETELPGIVKLGARKKKYTVGLSVPMNATQEQLSSIIQICELLIDSEFQIYTSVPEIVQGIHSDDIFFINSKNLLPRLNLCLIFIDNTEIDSKLSNCFIVNKGLDGQSIFQNISFEKITNHSSVIIDSKCHKLISPGNLFSKVNQLIIAVLKQINNKDNQTENSVNELKEIYGAFDYKSLNTTEESKKFYSYIVFKDEDIQKKFLILRSKIPSFEKVKDEFRKEHPNDTNFTILVHKNSRHKSNQRISRVKSIFQNEKCEYISDKIGKTVKKRFKQSPLTKSKIFIEPLLTDKSLPTKGNAGISEIQDWFSQENSPILFLIGQGGIGKTTVCQKLHDQIVDDNQIVLFINAIDIISELNDNSFTIGDESYDLYNFYTKWFPKTETHQKLLTRTEFYGNLSNGNIKIIFDGLDEIISSKPSFSLVSLVNYINDLIDISHMAKIIISIRDYQYKLLSKDSRLNHDLVDSYETFEVELFTDAMAHDYFLEKFNHTPNVFQECLKIISNIVQEGSSKFRYPPYLLFLISKIVAGDASNLLGTDIKRLIDPKKITLDKILIEYLQREYGKKSAINLGIEKIDQLKIMLDLAFYTKDTFTKSEADRIIKNIKSQEYYSEEFFRKLNDHPYFIFNEEKQNFSFQFEFLKDHLRSIKLYNIIKENDNKGEITLRFIAENLKPQTVLFKLLTDRITRKNLEVKIFLKAIVKQRLEGNHSLDIIDSISNLFQLCLEKVGKNKSQRAYTSVLKDIFEYDKNTGIIEGFVLQNCPHGHGISFDFSDLIIKDSIIDNYSRFFECKFNSGTLFLNDCTLNQISESSLSNKFIDATMMNFEENIKGDKSYIDTLLKKDKSYSAKNNITIKSFKRVLSVISKSNKLVSQSSIKSSFLTDKSFNNNILILTLDTLTENNILHKSGRSFRINYKENENVSMFLENTFLTKELASSIVQFKRKLEESK